jgi:hypothetical protein
LPAVLPPIETTSHSAEEVTKVMENQDNENRTQRTLSLRQREKVQKMLFEQNARTFPDTVL